MSAYKPIAAFVAAACIAHAGGARADDDAAVLRAELQSLKSDYETRIAALEARIAQLENTASAAEAVPAEATPPPSAVASASAFNPAISVILAGNYADPSRDPA